MCRFAHGLVSEYTGSVVFGHSEKDAGVYAYGIYIYVYMHNTLAVHK